MINRCGIRSTLIGITSTNKRISYRDGIFRRKDLPILSEVSRIRRELIKHTETSEDRDLVSVFFALALGKLRFTNIADSDAASLVCASYLYRLAIVTRAAMCSVVSAASHVLDLGGNKHRYLT